MVNENNQGLEADIGVSLGKLTRQLAAAEARMIKAAKRGEAAFKASNPRIVKSFQQIDVAASNIGRRAGGASNGLRQMSLQLSQVAQQGQATGNYIQALAIQLPDLALGLGPVGIAAGVAAGQMLPLIANMIGAASATEKLVDSLVGGEVGLSSARGSISQLRDIQEQYTKAIKASAGASTGTAAAVAANSKREFEARKQVLAVELELLRIRQLEQQSSLQILKDQSRIAATNAAQRNTSGIGEAFTPRDGRDFFNSGPRTTEDVLGARFEEENEKRLLSIRKLNAELQLTKLAAEETAEALNSEFADIEGGSASDEGSGSGRSQNAAKVRELRDELKLLEDQLKGLNSAAESTSSEFRTFLKSVITDSESAGDAISRLADRMLDDLLDRALSPISQAFGNLFIDALSGGVFGNLTGQASSTRAAIKDVRSFEGGGFTGFGARTGGVDGRGGFNAILHPNEKVIDLTKGQHAGVMLNQNLTLNVQGAAATDPRALADAIRPVVRSETLAVLQRSRREGR